MYVEVEGHSYSQQSAVKLNQARVVLWKDNTSCYNLSAKGLPYCMLLFAQTNPKVSVYLLVLFLIIM